MTTQLAASQEIKLESMKDGPGLLPFNLGCMNLITHYHTFLQYIEINDIEIKINNVRDQITDIENHFDDYTFSLYESRVQYLVQKLDKASYYLKSFEPGRAKRGLINGLGSIIKAITGNLDYNDAIRYNSALKTLEFNQDKIILETNQHISLSKDWMAEYSQVVNKLADNQIEINKTIQYLMNVETDTKLDTLRFAKFAQLLDILNDNIDEVLLTLRKIEDILAFTRTATAHHIMIGIDILRVMISRLGTIYSKNQLLDLELREYYNIIRSGSYYSEKRIVIVLRFPIVAPKNFNLYKLSILPNSQNQILIPPFPFIATNGYMHVYIEAECPKLGNTARYLCEASLNHRVRTTPNCISTLITSQLIDKSCKITTVSLSKEGMEKLDDQH